jgi:quinol monooxygenase YgiN
VPGPVIYVDTSDIREGRLADVRAGIARLADVVEREEPRLVSYAAFLDEDEGRMTVVHVHVDAGSLAFHMQVGGRLFAAFAELVLLRTIDVYGAVGADVRAALDAKARLLGGARVRTHPFHAGFVRAPAAG